MEKQTVFIKRYPSKGELPNKDKTWVIANGTGLNYFNGVFECPHTGEVQENIQWWLEEVELPRGRTYPTIWRHPLEKEVVYGGTPNGLELAQTSS